MRFFVETVDRVGGYFCCDDYQTIRPFTRAVLVSGEFVSIGSLTEHANQSHSGNWIGFPHWLYICSKPQDLCWFVNLSVFY